MESLCENLALAHRIPSYIQVLAHRIPITYTSIGTQHARNTKMSTHPLICEQDYDKRVYVFLLRGSVVNSYYVPRLKYFNN
jgi:hypothetical protein